MNNDEEYEQLWVFIKAILVPVIIGLTAIIIGIVVSKVRAVLTNTYYQTEKDRLMNNKPIKKSEDRPWKPY